MFELTVDMLKAYRFFIILQLQSLFTFIKNCKQMTIVNHFLARNTLRSTSRIYFRSYHVHSFIGGLFLQESLNNLDFFDFLLLTIQILLVMLMTTKVIAR